MEAQAKATDGVRQAFVSPEEAVRKRWFSLGKALGLRITETGSVIELQRRILRDTICVTPKIEFKRLLDMMLCVI